MPRWQPGIGYAYLTDETGLRRRRIPRRRLYAPLPPSGDSTAQVAAMSSSP